MRKWLACLVLTVCFMFGAVGWAQPQIPPVPTSGSIFVRDYAGVLSEDAKTKIGFMGSQLKGKTKAHVIFITVKSLEGSPSSEYALEIMRQWGIGDKTLNNGVVILVAVGDRQSRIEVGYGLEGRLPDAKTGRIQDELMVPYLQQGDYDKAALYGYQAVVGEVAKEYGAEIKIDATQTQTVHPRTAGTLAWWASLPWWAQILFGVVLLALLLVDWIFFGGVFTFLLLSLFRGGGGGGGGGGFGGGSGGGGGSDRRW